jgi:hypothetical protein
LLFVGDDPTDLRCAEHRRKPLNALNDADLGGAALQADNSLA